MAERPIFIPTPGDERLVAEKKIAFTWYPGFAISQAQKSIQSLHDSASREIDGAILEISSKSPHELGVALSAFNLRFHDRDDQELTVETAFQGSKVFEGDIQFKDLYEKSSRDAKTDERLKQSGSLIAFRFEGEQWPLEPRTAFYDWLYLRALKQNPIVATELFNYSAFTDIMFNPKKSINCQARSAALFVSLSRRAQLDEALSNKEAYLHIITSPAEPTSNRLFG